MIFDFDSVYNGCYDNGARLINEMRTSKYKCQVERRVECRVLEVNIHHKLYRQRQCISQLKERNSKVAIHSHVDQTRFGMIIDHWVS